MSLDPNRYDIEGCDGESGKCRATMETDSRGDWVSWDDYDDLRDAYNVLKDFVEKVREALP